MPLNRKRLTPEESRAAALEAARVLLISDGPQAVTLKAVAARIGRTHANLLHHFGSAAGLQRALAGLIADSVTAKVMAAYARAHANPDGHDSGEVVDLTFDAFRNEGAAALTSWMILNGNVDALDPILDAIHHLVDHIAAAEGDPPEMIAEQTLTLVLMALGDAMMGAPMARALGVPRERARELARETLARAIEARKG